MSDENKLVAIESPFTADIAENRAYLQDCIRDCLARGELPYASHQMYTDALDDTNVEQRKRGIDAGLEWAALAGVRVVYCDRGVSSGMLLGIRAAQESMQSIEFRWLYPIDKGKRHEVWSRHRPRGEGRR